MHDVPLSYIKSFAFPVINIREKGTLLKIILF